MILGIDQLGARLKAHYDKVIAFLVLLLLVSSLVYLGVKVGLIRQMQVNFDASIKSLSAKNPNAGQIESNLFDASSVSLEKPFKIEQNATNSYMFVPETRFSCRDCRLPVPIGAGECPHCHAVVESPKAPNPDADSDGMPTEWEERYGLDPFDPSDADKDNDGDGYSNLIEFKEGFDPTDPNSHPSAVEKLIVDDITGEKFGLQFKSRIRTGSGYKYALNYRLPTGETKTDFVVIGATVADVTIVSYKEIKVETRPNFPKKDVSELTVKTKDGDIIVLVKGKAALHVKLTAHLVLTLKDDTERKIDVTRNDEFEIEGTTYKVIAIDGDKSHVVIQDVLKNKKIIIRRPSES